MEVETEALGKRGGHLEGRAMGIGREEVEGRVPGSEGGGDNDKG